MRLCLLIAGALLAGPVLSDGLNYNFFELGYQKFDFDSSVVDADGDGLAFGGSVAVAPNFHLFAAYSKMDVDFQLVSVDLTES